MSDYTIDFKSLGMDDVGRVGGKNASLGEMISNLSAAGVSVPGGFATTADAYREFLQQDGLDSRINRLLDELADPGLSLLKDILKSIQIDETGKLV